MLEAGMLTAFAAAIAVLSRGLASGSPPDRAAIVISLMNFENSLPRAWSVAAFLRLIVAHLEWPDIDHPVALSSRAPRPPSLPLPSQSPFRRALAEPLHSAKPSRCAFRAPASATSGASRTCKSRPVAPERG